MTQSPKKIISTSGSSHQKQLNNQFRDVQAMDESERNFIDTIDGLERLQDYPIRDLVKHSEAFGKYLKQQGLETNQMRKFLDAVNRIKVILNQPELSEDEEVGFSAIKADVILLHPKLAYAAGRKETSRPLKPFSRVVQKAIDSVHSLKDFDRLVQLIESIIAYHKAEGGR
jgi:CRISPR-associated protein Csm2